MQTERQSIFCQGFRRQRLQLQLPQTHTVLTIQLYGVVACRGFEGNDQEAEFYVAPAARAFVQAVSTRSGFYESEAGGCGNGVRKTPRQMCDIQSVR